jgi:hypothetical protein
MLHPDQTQRPAPAPLLLQTCLWEELVVLDDREDAGVQLLARENESRLLLPVTRETSIVVVGTVTVLRLRMFRNATGTYALALARYLARDYL